MKKIGLKALALVLALLLGACAFAEAAEGTALAFETFRETYAKHTQEAWEQEETGLIRSLEPGEGVTVSLCLAGENVAALTVEFPCGVLSDAVRAAVESLGWLSEEELAAAFSLEENAELETETFRVYRIHGDNRDSIAVCPVADAENMLWQPIHGGKKIHDRPRCSGMDVSRMITQEAAEELGWEDCGTCRKSRKEETPEQKSEQEP